MTALTRRLINKLNFAVGSWQKTSIEEKPEGVVLADVVLGGSTPRRTMVGHTKAGVWCHHFWNLELGNVGEESLDIASLALFLAIFRTCFF